MDSLTASPGTATFRASRSSRALAAFYGLIGGLLLGAIALGAIGGVIVAVLGAAAGPPAPAHSQDNGAVAPVVGILFLLAVVGLYVLAGRAAVLVTADGILVVPFYGRARRYPWSAIAGFEVAEAWPVGTLWSDAGRWAVVTARLRDGRSVALGATRRTDRHRDEVEQMRAQLAAARPGAGPPPRAALRGRSERA